MATGQRDPAAVHFDPHIPDTVVYDVFADTATRLGGEYVYLADRCGSPGEKEGWKAKMFALRDEKRAVDPDDRHAQAEHIAKWREELEELRNR